MEELPAVIEVGNALNEGITGVPVQPDCCGTGVFVRVGCTTGAVVRVGVGAVTVTVTERSAEFSLPPQSATSK